MKASENRKGVRTVKQLERNGGRKQGSQEGLSSIKSTKRRQKRAEEEEGAKGGRGSLFRRGR